MMSDMKHKTGTEHYSVDGAYLKGFERAAMNKMNIVWTVDGSGDHRSA